MNYVLQFENTLIKSNGKNFQDCFYRLMKESYADFMPVKPYGRAGDNGCDGYLSNSGVYFQVYGPEEPYAKSSLSNAHQKVKSDFETLNNFIDNSNNFPKITSYIFVFNNKSDATVSMKISQFICELKKEFNHINFGLWDLQYLIKEFQSLCQDSQMRILGIYPDNNLGNSMAISTWKNEDFIQDVNNIRKQKAGIQKLLIIINENDFVSPFPIEALHLISELISALDSMIISDAKTEKIKNTAIERITVLERLIMYYTKPVIPYMGVMKRIGHGEEIEDEDFYVVQGKMFSARKDAYFLLKKFIAQEDILRGALST